MNSARCQWCGRGAACMCASMPLTDLQRRALDAIQGHISTNSESPTRNELAAAIATNRRHVDSLLDALARRRRIQIEPGVARGIVLLEGNGGRT